MINEEGFEPVMNPEVLAGEAGNPPRAGGMIEDAAVLVNLSTQLWRSLVLGQLPLGMYSFSKVEGIDSIEAFGALSGDSDVTEMAKKMVSCTVNAGRVILGTMQIKTHELSLYQDQQPLQHNQQSGLTR